MVEHRSVEAYVDKAEYLTSGLLAGATTMAVRRVGRRMLHTPRGRRRLPRTLKYRQSLGAAIGWAAAIGLLLAITDVLVEQRKMSTPGAGADAILRA